MGYALSKVLGSLTTPGTVLLLGLAFGVLMLWTRRWRGGRVLLTLLVLVAVGLTVLPFDHWALGKLEDRFPANPTLPNHIDGIVVLGGAVDQYLTQSRQQVALNEAGERLTVGAVLARLHPEARIVLTGGAADFSRPQPKEAPVMAALLVALGIDRSRMIVEDQSRNTYENAVFSQRLAQPGKGEVWVLVTSARHMPRSIGCFRAVDWPVIPYPVDFETGGAADWVNGDVPVQRLARLDKAAHEWAGLLFYRLSGWINVIFPGP